MIHPRSPWYKYKERIIEVNQDYNFSRIFRWTPEQIKYNKENNSDEMMAYLAIMKGESLAGNNNG